MTLRRQSSRLSGLRAADSSEYQDQREPIFRIGDVVRLKSGGPLMLVVDLDGGDIVAAWASGERRFPSVCVRRIKDSR